MEILTTDILNLTPFLICIVFLIGISHLKHWTEVGSDIEDVLHDRMVIWHRDNHIKANAGKCHLVLRPYPRNSVQIGNLHIRSSKSEELRSTSINIDSKFEKLKIYANNYSLRNC